jgi:hypothetical protein
VESRWQHRENRQFARIVSRHGHLLGVAGRRATWEAVVTPQFLPRPEALREETMKHIVIAGAPLVAGAPPRSKPTLNHKSVPFAVSGG